MPALPRNLPAALSALALLATGCKREHQAPAPPPAVAPITVPTRDDPNWSLKPVPESIAVPELTGPSRALQTLDHFILASLEANALPPAPPADPLTWFRRASIHLTGLPPTPAEIRGFVDLLNNEQLTDPQFIFAHTTDRLLASPAFGDQLATMWLDAVGYTDLFDTTTDRLNSQWPYRDWVVDSFNANLPYDEFLIAQLAGDLLQSPTPGQLLATAFLRTHPLDHGPELSPDEVIRRNTNARIDAFGNAILGYPLECARCHDAPNGLITRQQYQFHAGFFHLNTESGRPATPGVVPAPTLALPDDEQLAAINACADAEAATAKLLRQARLDGEDAFLAWQADPVQLAIISDLAAAFSFDEKTAKSPSRTLTGTAVADRGPLALIDGLSGKAVQCDGEHPVTLSNLFAPSRAGAWTFSFWIKSPADVPGPSTLLSHGPGLALKLHDGRLLATLQRDFPGNAIAIRTPSPAVPNGIWTHLAWSYDGSNTAEGLRLYVNGRIATTTVAADQLWGRPLAPGDGPPATLLGVPAFTGGLDDFQAFTRALTPLEIAHLHDGKSLPAAKRGDPTDEIRDYYFSSIDKTSRSLRRQLALDRKATLEAEAPVPEIAVARELAARLPGSPGPSTPDPFIPLPDNLETRRDLALHLTEPHHPGTARVFVNRLWARFFGQGLVATPNNLGPTGAAPLHPDLLDWLARDFVNHDWNIKRLCRQIVLSATYRRSSQATKDQLLRDPHNQLLARYPAHPLPPLATSEFLLAITGRLDTTRGGPPRPGTPRAPYGIWSPPLRSHDTSAPTCPLSARPTPTILASLLPPDEASLLTASRLLAQQTLEDIPDDTQRLRTLYATLAGRFPNPAEQAGLDALLADLQARTAHANAPQLIQPGTPTESTPPPTELALWTDLTRALLRSHTPLWVR